MFDYLTNRIKTWVDQRFGTYKYLCVKNKYFNDKYECIKCNHFDEFEDEKQYWMNQHCEIQVFELHKCINESKYRHRLPYERGVRLYDWTRTDNIYKGYPRRPT